MFRNMKEKLIYIIIITLAVSFLSACSEEGYGISNEKSSEGEDPTSAIAKSAGKPDDKSEVLKQYTDKKRRLKFNYPDSWSVQEVEVLDSLVIWPIIEEKDWQSVIYIEINSDLREKTIEKQLDIRIPEVRKMKKNFSLIERKIIYTKSGLSAGYFLYTNSLTRIKLKDIEYLIPVDNNKVILVSASIKQSLWEKHFPTIDLVLNSIELF
ncbi:MAG: hypothetical protein N3B21_13975 [Clostridia bacterium]|nr:hypothetical protein [Clostridia bacterium]